MEDREDKKCYICGNNHSLGSRDWTLAGHLCANRADRPNEWQMDEYIRKALELEQQNAELQKLSDEQNEALGDVLKRAELSEGKNAELVEALGEIADFTMYEPVYITSKLLRAIDIAQQALANHKAKK